MTSDKQGMDIFSMKEALNWKFSEKDANMGIPGAGNVEVVSSNYLTTNP